MSLGHWGLRLFSIFVLSISLGLAGVGCSDVLTYSKDSEREGLKFYRSSQYADAAGSFRNAVRQEPRRYTSYYYLGCSLFEMGQYQQSIQAFKTALDTMNTTQEGKYDRETRSLALDGLAQAIGKSTDRDSELALVRKRAQTKSSSQDYLLLAKIQRYSGDADAAIDAYNRAALLEPTNFDIAKEYGLYLEQLGQAQRAEIPLRRAYTMQPDDKEVASAMTRIGVIPGPSLNEEKDLAKPLLPNGPIPDLDLTRRPRPPANETAQTPRE